MYFFIIENWCFKREIWQNKCWRPGAFIRVNTVLQKQQPHLDDISFCASCTHTRTILQILHHFLLDGKICSCTHTGNTSNWNSHCVILWTVIIHHTASSSSDDNSNWTSHLIISCNFRCNFKYVYHNVHTGNSLKISDSTSEIIMGW